MGYKETYNRWLTSDVVDDDTKAELKSIENNEKEIEERFYRELEFGTAGMRGIIGAGTNRINIYNVRRASQGVAKYVLSNGEDAAKAGVLIGYDTRNFSRTFAEETAKVLTCAGVKTYLFPIVHSVPEVSFGIRELGCSAGVMITASHNPKEYNGYKVYGPDGGQLPPDAADVVVTAIDSYDIFDDVKFISLDEAKEKGLLEIVSSDLDEKFLDVVQTQQQNPEAVAEVADTFKLIYTPFHGTGSRPIKAILNRMGFKNVLVVKEQDTEDGNFPTVKSPNPEDKEGFEIAIKMAKENDVDVIIGTDPDCDRVGIVVRDADGIYRTLTGNQTGALLVEYILSSKKAKGTLPENGVVIKTIVTTELAAAIAHSYGIEIMNVLTGFKWIGDQIAGLEAAGEVDRFIFGFEESYGYLSGSYVRDKDGVNAAFLICEMFAYYKAQGISLWQKLKELYQTYGYCLNTLHSFTFEGAAGFLRMKEIMASLRQGIDMIGGKRVLECLDYSRGLDGLPKSDVLKFMLEDYCSVVIRPSGTEPKMKVYLSVSAEDMEMAGRIEAEMAESLKGFFE